MIGRREFLFKAGGVSLLMAAELTFGEFNTVFRTAEALAPQKEYTIVIDEDALRAAIVVGEMFIKDGDAYMNASMDMEIAKNSVTLSDQDGNTFTMQEFEAMYRGEIDEH